MKRNTKIISSEKIYSEEQKKFACLCAEDEKALPPEASDIGTYNEKRLHRVVKRLVCDDENCFEIKIGRYVADVLCEGMITEIQTGSFANLISKLRFYLESTDCNVTVIYPMIAEKTILRADKESGELIRAKRSPKHLSPVDALPELVYISEFIGDPRLEIRLLMIYADEYRYSEKIRYRKKGAYDNDVIPRELLGVYSIRSADDIKDIVPAGARDDSGHRAAELEKIFGYGGRRLYRALACLINLGILKKESEGKKCVKYYPADR